MKEISIYKGHKEVIIIAMSLSDIYNPKEFRIRGNSTEWQKTSSDSQNQHHTAEAKTSPIPMQWHWTTSHG